VIPRFGGSFLKMNKTKEEGNISTNCNKSVKRVRGIVGENDKVEATQTQIYGLNGLLSE